MNRAYLFVVYTSGLSYDDPVLKKHLTDERNAKIERLKNDKAKTQSFAAHLAACAAFRLLLDCSPEYSYDEKGKPQSPLMHINLSHADDAGLCIAADFPVSVDAESALKDRPDLANRVMSERELKIYRKTPAEFARVWTAKESVLKLIGGGIDRPLNGVETYARRAYDKRSGRRFFLSRPFTDGSLTICAASDRRFHLTVKYFSREEIAALLG